MKNTNMNKMKTFILSFCLLMGLATFVAPVTADAQIVSLTKPVAAKDTLTNADTTTIAIAVDNISRSVELYGLKRSGNVGTSKIYLEATINGTDYYRLDSLVLTDQSINKKKFNLRETNGDLVYKTYRAYCLSAGTCTWEPRVYHLRRSN